MLLRNVLHLVQRQLSLVAHIRSMHLQSAAPMGGLGQCLPAPAVVLAASTRHVMLRAPLLVVTAAGSPRSAGPSTSKRGGGYKQSIPPKPPAQTSTPRPGASGTYAPTPASPKAAANGKLRPPPQLHGAAAAAANAAAAAQSKSKKKNKKKKNKPPPALNADGTPVPPKLTRGQHSAIAMAKRAAAAAASAITTAAAAATAAPALPLPAAAAITTAAVLTATRLAEFTNEEATSSMSGSPSRNGRSASSFTPATTSAASLTALAERDEKENDEGSAIDSLVPGLSSGVDQAAETGDEGEVGERGDDDGGVRALDINALLADAAVLEALRSKLSAAMRSQHQRVYGDGPGPEEGNGSSSASESTAASSAAASAGDAAGTTATSILWRDEAASAQRQPLAQKEEEEEDEWEVEDELEEVEEAEGDAIFDDQLSTLEEVERRFKFTPHSTLEEVERRFKSTPADSQVVNPLDSFMEEESSDDLKPSTVAAMTLSGAVAVPIGVRAASTWAGASRSSSGSQTSTSGRGAPGRVGPMPVVVVKSGKARYFVLGSPMVYDGSIDRVIGRPPPEAGDVVLLADASMQTLGWGVYNPHSMFRVRLMQMASEMKVPQDGLPAMPPSMSAHIRRRVQEAVHLRRCLNLPKAGTNVYRLLNSEGDRLSGVVADVLGDTVVLQSSAAWAERYKDEIICAVKAATQLQYIVWRPDLRMLEEEGLKAAAIDNSYVADDAPCIISENGGASRSSDGGNGNSSSDGRGVVAGSQASCRVTVQEDAIIFLAEPGGQKTGFYADQRDSRAFIGKIAKGKTVLDLCCYSGGFALAAAANGAVRAIGVDSSASAIELAQANARLNNLDENVIFVKADITDFMRQSLLEAAAAKRNGVADGEKSTLPHQYDIVVLDPPKLAPNRASLARARIKYMRLNTMAMQLVAPGGLLMTCSCSGAMTQSGDFMPMLQDAAREADRQVSILRTAGPGPDHTLHPAYSEGAYLTNVTLRVL